MQCQFQNTDTNCDTGLQKTKFIIKSLIEHFHQSVGTDDTDYKRVSNLT